MKERPIIMSAESVRALLTDTKSQTRRVITPQPAHPWRAWDGTQHHWQDGDDLLKCPYGGVGDRLWVKEALVEKRDTRYPLIADWVSVVNYAADGALVVRKDAIDDVGWEDWLWQRPTLPAMFMPRWASRITLELTAVRVERVQDISVEDAIAEGITPVHDWWNETAGGRFCDHWDAINKKRGYGWDTNPYCWVLAFRRVEA